MNKKIWRRIRHVTSSGATYETVECLDDISTSTKDMLCLLPKTKCTPNGTSTF